jgi:hypothetical protein
MATTFNNVQAREIDFVTRFSDSWKALIDLLQISNAVKKAPGTTLRNFTTKTVLAESVDAGKDITASTVELTEVDVEDITLEKYLKTVTIEDVAKYGAEIAIQKTDDAFLNELQTNAITKWYSILKKGTLTGSKTTWQAAIAGAVGLVVNKFASINKSASAVVAFVNTLDAYNYLGTANITVQIQSGLKYIQNFIGADVVILSDKVEQGTVYATPAENIVLYYVDPSESDFAKLGLEFTVEGATNLIGFHANGNYSNATGESYALTGVTLWAEYLDGIAAVTVAGE